MSDQTVPKKQKKVKKIYLNDPLFESYIYVFIGEDRKELFESILKTVDDKENENLLKQRIFNLESYAEFLEFEADNGMTLNIIWFDKQFFSESAVAHEFFHAVMQILKRRGITYSEGSEEIYAYLMGFYIKQLYQKLRSKKWQNTEPSN